MAENNVQKAVPAAQTSKNATPVAPTSKAKQPLTKENLTKWVADGKGLRFMSEETGENIYNVKKALKEHGLKTQNMKESAKNATFIQQNKIYEAIKNGINTVDEITAMTGFGHDIVEAVVKKMMRDGVVHEVYAVVEQ